MGSPKRRFVWLVALVSVVALAGAACGSKKSDSSSSSTTAAAAAGASVDYSSLSGTINGSGATFPKAFYEEAISGFKEVASGVTVNYNAVGSGQGKKDLAAGTSDWAGTDSTVKDDEKATFKGPFLYFPTVAAPITVSFNVKGVTKLQLDADTLAKIFMGTITTWNDPAIAATNSGVTLPAEPIVVAVRSDGSGTTSNFSKYLKAAAPESFTLEAGDTVQWPNAQAAKGNAGVAQLVKDSEGAIGYVDYSDAKATGLTFASIKNKDGQFVAASLDGATAAAASAEVKPDLTYNPLNASGAAAYPITAPTYIIVYTAQSDAAKGNAIKGWINFVLTDGQALAADVDFAKLPDSLQQKAVAQLSQLQIG